MFSALSISGSGAEAMQTWIDTSAGNVANMSDTVAVGKPAYGAQTPFLSPVATGGAGEAVQVSRVTVRTTLGIVTYQPTSPIANAQGDVVVPNVDLASQMVGMVQAQDGYQVDTAMMQKAMAAYTAGLTIGS